MYDVARETASEIVRVFAGSCSPSKDDESKGTSTALIHMRKQIEVWR